MVVFAFGERIYLASHYRTNLWARLSRCLELVLAFLSVLSLRSCTTPLWQLLLYSLLLVVVVVAAAVVVVQTIMVNVPLPALVMVTPLFVHFTAQSAVHSTHAHEQLS